MLICRYLGKLAYPNAAKRYKLGSIGACRGCCCVGTWARLGYATFDAQLQKAYFVATLYAIRTSVRACVRVIASSPRDMSTQ